MRQPKDVVGDQRLAREAVPGPGPMKLAHADARARYRIILAR